MALPYKAEKVETFEVADDSFLAVFPRGHGMGEFETMTPARLDRDALLVLEEGNCLTDQILAMGKFGERVRGGRFQATSLHTLVQMVDNGLGVTVLPKMSIDAGILRGLKLDFRPFSSPKACRRIVLAWRKSTRRGDEFRMLGEFLRDELGTPVRGQVPVRHCHVWTPLHGVAKQFLQFILGPGYAGAVLVHFQSRHGDAAGVCRLARRQSGRAVTSARLGRSPS